MNKSPLHLFIVAFILILLFFLTPNHFSVAQTSGTNVTGVINSTSWTSANGPYNLIGNVLVNNGAILKIEAGTIVNLGSYYMSIKGILDARGNSNNPIVFNGGQYIDFAEESPGWDDSTSSGCIIENSIINSPLTISSSPKINSDIINGAITLKLMQVGTPMISNSIIKGGISANVHTHAYISNNTILYQGLSFGSTGNVANIKVSGNTITGCSAGIIIARWVSGIFGNNPDFQLIENNLIFNNTIGISINDLSGADTGPNIQNNTVVSNKIGLSINGGTSSSTVAVNERILNNNVYGNTNYNVKNQDANRLNVLNNWWGTNDTGIINQTMYDFKNDFTFGNVNFVPFLNELNPKCPTYTSSIQTPTSTPMPTQSTSPNNTSISTPTPQPTSNPPFTNKTQISLIVDVTSTNVGSSVHLKGKLSDAKANPLTNKQITLSYGLSSSSSMVPIGSGITNDKGEYDIQWVNTASGTFTLKTEWTGNTDYYGASNTTTISFLPYNNQNVFLVESNSTITALAFNSTSSELSFTVNGTLGSTGYVKTTIEKALVQDAENIKVSLDGEQLNYFVESTENSWVLNFNYHLSIHQVKINLGSNTSESTSVDLQSWILALVESIVIVTIVIGIIFFIRRRKQRSNRREK